MKTLVVAVTLVLLVLLGVHIDSGLPSDFSTLADYYASPRDAFYQISNGSWFETKTLNEAKTDGWPPTLQCPVLQPVASNSTDPPLDPAEHFCAKPTARSAPSVLETSAIAPLECGGKEPSFSVSTQQSEIDLLHYSPEHSTLFEPDDVENPGNMTTSNDALMLDLDARLQRFDNETHEINCPKHSRANVPFQDDYDFPTEETRLSTLLYWHDILQYVHAVDRESPTSKWLEYLDFLLLFCCIAHFGPHLRDFVELESGAYCESRPALLSKEYPHDGNGIDSQMNHFLQRKVKTIKVSPASANVKSHAMMDTALWLKPPLLLTETANDQPSAKTTDAVQSEIDNTNAKNNFEESTHSPSTNHRGQTDSHPTKTNEPTLWRGRLAVTRAAICLSPVF